MICMIRYGLIALFAVMLGSLVHAAMSVGILEEGRVLMEYVWFRATLIDLYLGLILAGIWAFYRERSRLVAALWFLSFLLLGNLTVVLYAWVQLMRVRGKGDLATFFQGHRAS